MCVCLCFTSLDWVGDVKEEDDVDDEEDDDLTRRILSNQFGRIHYIYIYAWSFDTFLPAYSYPACARNPRSLYIYI